MLRRACDVSWRRPHCGVYSLGLRSRAILSLTHCKGSSLGGIEKRARFFKTRSQLSPWRRWCRCLDHDPKQSRPKQTRTRGASPAATAGTVVAHVAKPMSLSRRGAQACGMRDTAMRGEAPVDGHRDKNGVRCAHGGQRMGCAAKAMNLRGTWHLASACVQLQSRQVPPTHAAEWPPVVHLSPTASRL
jgi:hypothetical protein